MIQTINSPDEPLGLTTQHKLSRPRIYSFTSSEFSQQLARIQAAARKAAFPHIRIFVLRKIQRAQEASFTIGGRDELTFAIKEQHLKTRILAEV